MSNRNSSGSRACSRAAAAPQLHIGSCFISWNCQLILRRNALPLGNKSSTVDIQQSSARMKPNLSHIRLKRARVNQQRKHMYVLVWTCGSLRCALCVCVENSASYFIIEYGDKSVLFVRVSVLMDVPHKTSTIRNHSSSFLPLLVFRLHQIFFPQPNAYYILSFSLCWHR